MTSGRDRGGYLDSQTGSRYPPSAPIDQGVASAEIPPAGRSPPVAARGRPERCARLARCSAMDDNIDLDEAAERVRARLAAEGTTLPLEFVRDVVYVYVAATAQQPALARPAERASAVKRVAGALLEDQAVVRRIVEALIRDQEAHPPPVAHPVTNLPAAAELAAPDAVRIAARLNDAGVPVTTDLVGRVMTRLL